MCLLLYCRVAESVANVVICVVVVYIYRLPGRNKYKCVSPSDISNSIQKLRLGSVVPKELDLHGAAQALIRLQDVYELDIADIAGGKIGDIKSAAKLSAQDCLFIGETGFGT